MSRARWDHDDVVAEVLAAIQRVPAAGRFGGDRVFVSALWRAFSRDAFDGITFDDFKKRLIAANRKRQITLARADLTAAMNPATVIASEIAHLNSTFHFVVDWSRQRT